MPRSKVTSRDVARRAGVSQTTVSFALDDVAEARISEETRQRVLEAIEEIGYVPDARAQALSSGKTNTIALLVPDLRNPHFSEFVTGVEKAVRAADYHFF